MDKEEKILKELESLKEKNSFKVPDGYFDSFNSRLMDKMQKEKEVSWFTSVLKTAKPQIAFAFSFALFALIALTFTRLLVGDPKVEELSLDEIAYLLEEEAYSLDENELFAFVDESENNTIIDKENNLTEDDIIQYLNSEGDNLELLMNDF